MNEDIVNDVMEIKAMLKEILVILEETASKEDKYSIRSRREDREENKRWECEERY